LVLQLLSLLSPCRIEVLDQCCGLPRWTGQHNVCVGGVQPLRNLLIVDTVLEGELALLDL
jgi:hypothetical protein